MDFSAANTALWSPVIQIGIIAALLIAANILRRKVALIRNSLMPTAVLAGFILLGLCSAELVPISSSFLESVTYHALAIGFIAMSLRKEEKVEGEVAMIGSKSGALIVSTYLVQALTGLVIALVLAYTVMPDLFKASGILLPMAYGQGPGNALSWDINFTNTPAAMFSGNGSFGLSLASIGFVVASVFGILYINIYKKKGLTVRKDRAPESLGVDTANPDGTEIPDNESVDKFTLQMGFVAVAYALSFGFMCFLGSLSNFTNNIAWGFNFLWASL